MALQEREMAFRKFEAGVRPGYQAFDFSFVSYKSSLTKKLSRPTRQKFSTLMHTPLPLSQPLWFKDKTPPLPIESQKTCLPSWDIFKHKFNAIYDKENQDSIYKSWSISLGKFTKYGLLEETEAFMGLYFLDKQ